jgi:RNA ligase (TIGR02306 family)
MSKLIVEICRILEINEHPNADRLQVAKIKGWDVVVKKDSVSVGDLVVYIPPDAVLPSSLHEFLGITQYCAELPKGYQVPGETLPHVTTDGLSYRPLARRVKAARLRGVASYGTIMTKQSFVDYWDNVLQNAAIWKSDSDIEHGMIPMWFVEGHDVCQALGITKWEPPPKATQGDAAPEVAVFHKYTSIEHYRNYPDVFEEGEEVVVLEKIHGTNCRVGAAVLPNEDGEPEFTLLAGSHNTRRKQGMYWEPFQWCAGLEFALRWNASSLPMIIFGEIFGPGVQDMAYGQPTKGFRMFDISCKGKYLSWDTVKNYASKFDIPLVPELYRGPYYKGLVEEYTDGKTTLSDNPGKFKGREGVVIKPVVERTDPTIGRAVLKSVSVDYLSRKGGTDSH